MLEGEKCHERQSDLLHHTGCPNARWRCGSAMISAASIGVVWAVSGGAANHDQHLNGAASTVERVSLHPTQDIALKESACLSQSLHRNEPGMPAGNTSIGARDFSIVRPMPFADAALKRQGKKLTDLFPNFVNQGRKFNPPGEVTGPLVTAPELRVLVIFVQFTNAPPGGPVTRLDLGYYDDMLFGTEYAPDEYRATSKGKTYLGPTDRTLKNYFREVSYGQVDVVTFDMPSTMGWGQAGHNYEYYCRADGIHNNGFGPYPENVLGLARDAVAAVDNVVDFSKYAVNGQVPNLFIVHAGTGAEWSTDPAYSGRIRQRLSYEPTMPERLPDERRVFVDTYAMMPEVGGDLTGYMFGYPLGPYPPTVGTYAHEFGMCWVYRTSTITVQNPTVLGCTARWPAVIGGFPASTESYVPRIFVVHGQFATSLGRLEQVQARLRDADQSRTWRAGTRHSASR